MGSPQGAFPSGNIYLLQCGVPHGLQGIYLLQNSPLCVLQWNLCFGIWREGPLPLASSSLTLLLTRLIAMRLFFPSLLTLMAGILPFLKHIFTKVLLPHAMRLMASAASCMGSFWGWLEQVVSSIGPWPLVRKATPAVPHYQHLDTDTQIILTDFLSGARCPTFSRCNSNLFFGRVLV